MKIVRYSIQITVTEDKNLWSQLTPIGSIQERELELKRTIWRSLSHVLDATTGLTVREMRIDATSGYEDTCERCGASTSGAS